MVYRLLILSMHWGKNIEPILNYLKLCNTVVFVILEIHIDYLINIKETILDKWGEVLPWQVIYAGRWHDVSPNINYIKH